MKLKPIFLAIPLALLLFSCDKPNPVRQYEEIVIEPAQTLPMANNPHAGLPGFGNSPLSQPIAPQEESLGLPMPEVSIPEGTGIALDWDLPIN